MAIKSKKGWLRLVEAMVAIILIMGVILAVSTRRGSVSENDLTPMINPLVEEIANDAALRAEIVSYDLNSGDGIILKETLIGRLLESRIAAEAYGYTAKICPPESVCGLEAVPAGINGDIYTSERIITAIPDSYAPKKIKIFVWRKA